MKKAPHSRALCRLGSIALSLLWGLSTASADFRYELVRAFGFPERSGQNPYFSSADEGHDGVLYGTTLYSGAHGGGVIFRMNKDGSGYRVIKSFQPLTERTYRGVIHSVHGPLYGITSGFTSNAGTIFRINTDGSDYATLYTFPADRTQGAASYGRLVEASDGALYGTTIAGGEHDGGVVFKINPDGSGFRVLHHFAQNGDDGCWGGVIEASDGALYGTTRGPNGGVYRVTKAGSYTSLHQFSVSANDGHVSYGPVIEGEDEYLYGTASFGGSYSSNFTYSGYGVVFKLRKNGADYQILHSFSRADGAYPDGGLAQMLDGYLYGTTSQGGASNSGTLFRLATNGGSFAVLHHFGLSVEDGKNSMAALSPASDGRLFGTCIFGGRAEAGTIFQFDPLSDRYSNLHHFSYSGGDGIEPQVLFQASNGDFYGVAYEGGSSEAGVVFRYSLSNDSYHILHNFARGTGGGILPNSLLEGSDHFLYGTAYGSRDTGTVFKISLSGAGYEVLASFPSQTGLLRLPTAIVEGSDGALYVALGVGGPADNGAILKLARDGSASEVIHAFNDSVADGSFPDAGLIEGSDGFLYGLTRFGGAAQGGTLFKLSKDGMNYTILYSFFESGRLVIPSGLMEAGDGLLYGTTANGGGNGTVFRISRQGDGYRVLHRFRGSVEDGERPGGTLREGSDGFLYGLTAEGGAYEAGTMFQIDKDGSCFHVVHSFSESESEPGGRLVRARDGFWYGLTRSGGLFGGEDFGVGTVFRIIPERRLEILRSGALLTVRWQHDCVTQVLEHSPALGAGANWQPWTGEVFAGAGYRHIVVPPDTQGAFFRLREASQ